MMRKEKIPRSVNEPKQREQNMRQKESRTVWPFEGFWTIKGHPTHPVSTGSWLLAPKLPSWLVAPPTPKHRNTPHQVQIIRMNFQPPTTPFFWLTQIYPIDPSSEEAAPGHSDLEAASSRTRSTKRLAWRKTAEEGGESRRSKWERCGPTKMTVSKDVLTGTVFLLENLVDTECL